jgi:hypothetical protein
MRASIAQPVVPVGTSGDDRAPARVEPRKGGEFLRVAVNRGSERYLIHLAVARLLVVGSR